MGMGAMCLLATEPDSGATAFYSSARPAAGVAEPLPLNERAMAAIWNDQKMLRGPFWTTTGEPLAIVYRGRWTGGAGPDFHDAIVAIGNSRPQRGDIELHLRAADWFAHGHQHDPAYDNVILHVVYSIGAADADGLAQLAAARHANTAGGRDIPTLVLAPHLKATPQEIALLDLPASLGDLSDDPCWTRTAHRPLEELLAILGVAGDRRLHEKAARYESDLAPLLETVADYEREDAAETVLYAGLCDALGYSANREPFARLAERMPLRLLRVLAAGHRLAERVAILEAALLGAAGLLPSQRPRSARMDWQSEAQAEELELQWTALRPLLSHMAGAGGPGPSSSLGWTFGGGRPANNPVRRVAALAHLLAWLLPGGLIAGFLEPLRSDNPVAPRELCARWLERLHIPANGSFWSEHADFGMRLGAAGRSFDLIGADRSREMLINVVLPLLLAWGEYGGGAKLREAVDAVYCIHPPLAANEITRAMSAEAFGDRARHATKNARLQQGLIHLYRNSCSLRDLGSCPLSGLSKRSVTHDT